MNLGAVQGACGKAAAEKFVPAHDHTRSTAIAQATQAPPSAAPPDAAGRHAAADQLRYASGRYKQGAGAWRIRRSCWWACRWSRPRII